MINEIDIRNFRCFQHLKISGCRQINVIVGDNGSGKTALIEAVFLALGVTTDMVMRYRQFRGLEARFQGSTRTIENAIWNDFFHNQDLSRSISIILNGTGPEARSLTISRGAGEATLSLGNTAMLETTAPVGFHWRDSKGKDFYLVPSITPEGIKFPITGEDMPDFFYIPASQTTNTFENAERFSSLKKRRPEFIRLFTQEFKWVTDLSIEVNAAGASIHAAVQGMTDSTPIGNLSGGINRLISILLPMASRQRSVVLVDEIENGIYFKHHTTFWKALISYARNYESQLFVSTHSAELLKSLVTAAGKQVDDIALWRIERDKENHPVLNQFNGEQVMAGIEAGGVR